MRQISNVLVNGALMSAQESVYMNLSLPLIKNSRTTIFINTSKIDDRVRMMKRANDLAKMQKDDTEIVLPNLMQKYSGRTQDLENICLADFAAEYSEKKLILKKIQQ